MEEKGERCASRKLGRQEHEDRTDTGFHSQIFIITVVLNLSHVLISGALASKNRYLLLYYSQLFLFSTFLRLSRGLAII